MSLDRKMLEDRIHKKRLEIASLEDKLKAAKVYITALSDVLKLIQGEEPTETTEAKLRPGGTMAKARKIILERGEPVHIDELLIAMGKSPTREEKASMVGSIAAYVRREEIFTRPAPNTFGLIELGHDGVGHEEIPDEPPAGFGTIPVRRPSAFDADLEDDVPF